MNTPETTSTPDTPPDVGQGSDVEVDAQDLDQYDTPATSDPDSFVDDANLGGVGGTSPGGAG